MTQVDTPLSGEGPEPLISSSSKKIDTTMAAKHPGYVASPNVFAFFSMLVMQSIFSVVACPDCKHVGIDLTEVANKKQGLAITLSLQCPCFLWEHEFLSSPYADVLGKTRKNNMEINVRVV